MNALLEPAPTPLDLVFRLYGTHVRVSASFWVLPVVVGGFIAVFFGPPYLLLAVGCFFLSVLLHEFGHVLAGRWFGQEGYVVLNAFGGVAVGCAEAFERWQRIVVFAAGPGIQLVAAGVLWVADSLVVQRFPSLETDYPLVVHSLAALLWINLGLAAMSMLPLGPPLDGWYIARELFSLVRGRNRPPWEQDPDWWKPGADRFHDSRSVLGPDPYRAKSNRLPLAILIGAATLVLGWHTLRDYKIATATDLMAEFKKDPDGAMARYGHRDISFRAVLKRPPWERALCQYEGGKEAMIYFVTDNPDEWLFCTVPYDARLRDLKESGEYRVRGRIYYFESQGKLYLHHGSVKLVSGPPASQ